MRYFRRQITIMIVSDPNFPYKAIIFNLDGVLVDTASYHYTAWRMLANGLGFDFTEQQHEALRGLSRMASLERILQWGGIYMSEAEQLHLADVKNNWYTKLITEVKPSNVLPGVVTLLEELRENGIQLALSSASRSARNVLKSTNLELFFDEVVDGYSTRKSKPDPECFQLAARALGKSPADCMVFEDSMLGVKAAIYGGFTVVGIGRDEYLHEAHYVIPGFQGLSFENLAAILTNESIISNRNWFAWSHLRQKSGHFLPDEADFCRP